MSHKTDYQKLYRKSQKANKDLYNLINQSTQSKNMAYWERNQLVCLISKIYPSWIELHPEKETSWDKEWRHIVYVQTPVGQASWHIHDSDLDDFEHLEIKDGSSWDGHTVGEKYHRLSTMKPQWQKEQNA